MEMVVDGDGQVGETRFSRSLIRSERRLTYGEVDAALDGGSLGEADLQRDVTELAALARVLPGAAYEPRGARGVVGGAGGAASRATASPRSTWRARRRRIRWWRSA